MGNRFLDRGFGDLVEHDPVQLLVLQQFLVFQDLGEMPGYGLTFAIRVGREVYVAGLGDRLRDRVYMFLVLLHQRVAHVKIVAGIDRAFLRFQIAHVTIGRDDFEAAAEILLESFRLGGRLYDQQTLGH